MSIITVHHSITTYITVYHSISQYTTVYHSISQYTTVYHSILQYITVYYSISQYITVYNSIPQCISQYTITMCHLLDCRRNLEYYDMCHHEAIQSCDSDCAASAGELIVKIPKVTIKR